MRQNRLRNERGVALILALGLLIIIASVALIVATSAIIERGLTATERQQKMAFDAMEQTMQRAISQFDPKNDMKGFRGYRGLIETQPYGGGTLVGWMGVHDDSIPMVGLPDTLFNNPHIIHPLDFPLGMHLEGEAIYIRYSNMHATARIYRAGGATWLAQKEAATTVDVGPYGWQP